MLWIDVNKGLTVCFLSKYIDNILATDPADMKLLSKFNNGILFLLCVADTFSKYAWVVPLKDKKTYYNYWRYSENFKWIWTQTEENMCW